MPRLTRWFIRTAMIYLGAALLVGVVQMVPGVLYLPTGVSSLWPVYIHLFVVGWITQLIFGVAYWMFPRYSREQYRGSVELAWAVYLMLNAGLVLRAVGEPMHALLPEGRWGGLLAASAVLQWLAGLGFVINTWARVKER